MTVDDYARKAANIQIVRQIAKDDPADGLLLVHSIANAIRAAVAEFKERAAKVVENKLWKEYNGAAYQGEFAVWIAARIRELE